MPSGIEDRYIQPNGFGRLPADGPPFTGFLALLQVGRLFSPLYRALKYAPVPSQTIQSLEDKVSATLLLLPGSCQPSSEMPIETTPLSAIVALQIGRAHV